MTQIEKIRAMSAEELAKWLMDEVEQGNFNDFCDGRYCEELAAHGDEFDACFCSDQRCLAAAVRYLESEVEGK
jgi:hypothetical protein